MKLTVLVTLQKKIKTGILAHYAYVFMVQPLVDNAPAFC